MWRAEPGEAAEEQRLAAVACEEALDAREPRGTEADAGAMALEERPPEPAPEQQARESPATARRHASAIRASSDASPRSAATPPASSASSPWMTNPTSAVVSRNTSATTAR